MTTGAKTDRWIATGLFVLALVTYAWWDPGPGWNQNANFDLARSMVERQTFNIDGYHVNTRDTSIGRHGQIYSNKPPGLSLLAAIPYAVVYWFESARHIPVDDLKVMRVNLWIITTATCGVAGALMVALLYLYGRRRAGVSAAAALSVAFLIAFGTIVFAYSTVLFAHVPAALLLFLAFVWLDGKPFLSGFAAGLASLCFYFSIPAALVLTVAALWKSRRHALLVIAGGVPAACFLAFYQYRCFGSVFRTSSEMSKGFTTEGLLLGMFYSPRFSALYGTTFSPYRGLFFLSPVLLLALVGAFVMIRSGRMRRELNVAAALVALLLFLVSCYSWWDGGWAIGPRFLLQAIPLLAVPMFFATARLRPVWIVAGLVSLIFNFTAVAVDPMPSHEVKNPIRDYILPAFVRGTIPEPTRVALKRTDAVTGHVSLNPVGTNLGELWFAPGSLMTIVPVAAWMALGFAGLWWVAGRTMRRP
jgi:hypothetical protein